MLFGEVNDRIVELLRRAAWGAEADFLCECGRADCDTRVTLGLSEYEAIRLRGGAIVAPGCAPHVSRPGRAGAGRLAAPA